MVQTAGPGQRGAVTEAAAGGGAPQRGADTAPVTAEGNPKGCSMRQ